MNNKFTSTVLLIFLFAFILWLGLNDMCFAYEEESITNAFGNAEIDGTIGSYFEFTDADAANSDFGWANSYLTVKFETQQWNQCKFTTRFFAHGQVYSDHDNANIDPFESDIETPYTLPEIYLNYAFADASSVTLGRWDHRKMSHIDDAQSEGVYLSIKEMPEFDLDIGVMSRFAEIDYDDSEDFGRLNKSQNLDSDNTYGTGSQGFLVFIEAKSKAYDLWDINPYLMHQDGYATVCGIDTNVDNKEKDSEVYYGSKIDYYFVGSDKSGSSNSSNFALFPYVVIEDTKVTLGYANFDNGNSLNKPEWLRDYFTLVDQQKEYGVAGSEKYFAKVKFIIDEFWMNFVCAENNYDFNSNRGDRAQEFELQFGYNLSESADLNIRFFDVQYDKVGDKDYHKVESRIRFKF